ncbi:hypothetical protein GCM10025734_25750 [Kitasatospora paranensis]
MGAATPWQYFTDHTDPGLAEAVRQGRRREFAEHGWRPEDVPDPQARATVLASVLDWSEPAREPHAGLLDWYRRLIRLRRTHPELTDPDLGAVRVDHDAAQQWLVVHRGPYRVVVHLGGDGPRRIALDRPYADTLALFGDAWPESDGSLHLAAESTAVVRVG